MHECTKPENTKAYSYHSVDVHIFSPKKHKIHITNLNSVSSEATKITHRLGFFLPKKNHRVSGRNLCLETPRLFPTFFFRVMSLFFRKQQKLQPTSGSTQLGGRHFRISGIFFCVKDLFFLERRKKSGSG